MVVVVVVAQVMVLIVMILSAQLSPPIITEQLECFITTTLKGDINAAHQYKLAIRSNTLKSTECNRYALKHC